MRFMRKLTAQANVNLVPMIDVVFQLVIFFMVSTTFLVTPAIKLILPGSSTAEPTRMDRIVISVFSRDEVYFNQDRYDLPGLAERLGRITDAEQSEIGSVIIEGDQTVSYSFMVEVLDVLRENNLRGVSLRTREVRREE